MDTPEPARYLDGAPANLPAAAWDALEWLKTLPRLGGIGEGARDNDRRLLACIAALEKELAPHLPAQFAEKED